MGLKSLGPDHNHDTLVWYLFYFKSEINIIRLLCAIKNQAISIHKICIRIFFRIFINNLEMRQLYQTVKC